MGSVIVIGAGPSGLATGMLLAQAGINVTVLDKDPTAPPETAEDGWEHWLRPGVAQFRQAHTLMPRGAQVLESHLPQVLETLRNLGAHPFDFLEARPRTLTHWTSMDGDERFRSLGARRPTYELAFAVAARDTTGLELLRGVPVRSLIRDTSTTNGVPNVRGVETEDGQRIEADLIVDAAGRRSPLPRLLESLGARPPAETSEDSRFVYYTQHFRRREGGEFPKPYMLSLYPAGSITLLTLMGDNDTWSVTIYATTADRSMRAAKDPAVFESIVRAHPLQAHWLEGDPITGVEVMAGISDRERSMYVEGSPVATGILPVGDAWACTNPSLGRGMSMALMHISHLLPAIARNLDNPTELIEQWESITQSELEPWHRQTLAVDRARNQQMDAIRNGEADPDSIPSVYFDSKNPDDAAFFAAMGFDQYVFRAGLEMTGLFTSPAEVQSRPEVRRAVAAVGANMPPLPSREVPSRAELEQLLAWP